MKKKRYLRYSSFLLLFAVLYLGLVYCLWDVPSRLMDVLLPYSPEEMEIGGAILMALIGAIVGIFVLFNVILIPCLAIFLGCGVLCVFGFQNFVSAKGKKGRWWYLVLALAHGLSSLAGGARFVLVFFEIF